MSTYTHPRFGTGTIIGVDGSSTIIDFGGEFGIRRLVTALLGTTPESRANEAAAKAAKVSAQKQARRVKAAAAAPVVVSAATIANNLTNALTRYRGDFSRENALNMVAEVAAANKGFASEVAATVLKYEKASDKQAAVIAAAYMTI
jgi:hypothetical protein